VQPAVQYVRALGACSSQAAARRLLGPLARVQRLDGEGRRQGQTSLVEFYGAHLPAWLPAPYRDRAVGRALELWGSIRFIRKTFTVGQEHLILRSLFAGSFPSRAGAPPPVPRLLGLGAGWVLMEDLSGSGGCFQAADVSPLDLAEAVSGLQAYLAEAESRSGLAMPRHQVLRNLSRLRALVRRTSVEKPSRWLMRERAQRLVEHLHRLPQRLSHNDIGPGNLAVYPSASAACRIRFIDFGSVHHNVIGADLHHYAVWGLDSPGQQQFFDQLACRYAELECVSLAAVRAGAYGYAIERTVMRWWRRTERRKIHARTLGYRTRLEHLLQRAEVELGLAPQG
jgi:hypothetical protein